MRAFSVAVAVALFLTACGGADDDGDGEPSDARRSVTSGSPTVEQDVAADQAIAEAAVLTLDDMPPGWTSEAAGEDDASEERESRTRMARCVGDYETLYVDAHPDAESDDFTSPDDAEVSVDVRVAHSEEWLVEACEVFSTDRFRECALEELQNELGGEMQEVTVGDISLDPLSFAPVGDEVTVYRMTIPISADGFDVEMVGDVVAARVGRGMVWLSAFSLPAQRPLGVEELRGSLEIAADRLSRGLASAS
ncbi:hypothetical protein [Nocardioides sp. J54]|uniref:hypothetical protein n=1 Tax=Nocardioides sp. J54 TaxID=935866 RepID=UPI00048C6D9F|nr:hypothetical protein [Nocardioides sp. J54]